jgi:DNA-3-methyladenine glycosylase
MAGWFGAELSGVSPSHDLETISDQAHALNITSRACPEDEEAGEAIYREGRRLAGELITRHAGLVRVVAEELDRRGSIPEREAGSLFPPFRDALSNANNLGPAFFSRDAVEVAHDLIGATLIIEQTGGIIVETEAYQRADPASHSFVGPTVRNAVMSGAAGTAYVYRSYGIHWCMNFVCGEQETGSAVLVRALEPIVGVDIMRVRRGLENPILLCTGPGRLCQALGVTGEQNGQRLDKPPFEIYGRRGTVDVRAGTRIGISRATNRPWRFALLGSRFVSKPRRR